MAEPVWKVGYCEYNNVEDQQGQVKVTNLHYTVDQTDGEFTAHRYGSTSDDQNRVYTLAALQNVPEQVMVGWVQQDLGSETVAEIEQSLADEIYLQENPTGGGFTPSEPEDEPT